MKYIFRGNVVFDYDPITKELHSAIIHPGRSIIDFCRFIPNDYLLMSQYFLTIFTHTQGMAVELKDIEVN